MKRIILLVFLIFSLSVNAQEFYSSGKCKAGFKFAVNPDIKTLVPATAINFYDTSVGEVKQWFWDFGDSITSNEQNPMIIFNHPIGGPNVKINPYRKISLTILTADECKSFYSLTINYIDGTVYDTKPGCKAVFKYYISEKDSASGIATVQFNNYSEGENLSYYWQFGNGITSTEKEPVVRFDSKQPEYKVCLTVKSADGCSNIMCDAVYIQPTVIPGPADPKCQVGFGYKMKDILMGPIPSMAVDFYYKSYPEAIKWHWDFGDGETSNEPNPTHVYYQKNGTDKNSDDSSNSYRTVCLTILTEDTCKTVYCETIKVFEYKPEPEKCKAYFKYYRPDDVITIPELVPIRLVDVSEGDVIAREWIFADGTKNSEKEPLVMFDIFKPEHKVVLTVWFADSCVNTYYGKVILNHTPPDSTPVEPNCPYVIKVDGGFPVEMSSCAGWASARIYLENELVEPAFIGWSTGDTLAKISGLCPSKTYTVKALMSDGCTVWTSFVLGADGTVTVVNPVNWWLSGEREKLYVRSDATTGMTVEWRLCDGTIVKADSIPLEDINCGDNVSNLIVKDSMGNIVYSEMIALKGSVTAINENRINSEVILWPNPVTSTLKVRYSGAFQPEMVVEVCDVMGKRIITDIYQNISDQHEFSVNTESLKPGIYICKLSAKGKMIGSQKFSRK